MWRTIVFVLIVVAVMIAQTAGPSSLTFSPLGPSSSCMSSATGNVLCAATDGFYVSIAGGAFQKIPLAVPSYTQLTCTNATLSSGATGSLTATGCTFK